MSGSNGYVIKVLFYIKR